MIKSIWFLLLSSVLILSILTPSYDIFLKEKSHKEVSSINDTENDEKETNDIEEEKDIEEEEDLEEKENLFLQTNIVLKLNNISHSVKNICLNIYYINSFFEINIPPPKLEL